jgi:hypothetical protein
MKVRIRRIRRKRGNPDRRNIPSPEETKNNAFRFNPFYRYRDFTGKFVANPNAQLPDPDMGLHMGLYDNSLGGFDWLGEENNTSFTYDDLTLDLMVRELAEKGYCY